MSMCNMPLLIKVEMTKENFEKLLEEAKTRYQPKYLETHYIYDGKYFSLDLNEWDDFEIYKEADMIAKHAEPTEKQVGLIFTQGCSYTMGDLYFTEGMINVRNDAYKTMSDWEKYKADYWARKEEFLNSFL